ncbi:Ig-like domain-containing protein [Nocardioides plantarum]|uniref:Ig-like domain-containing protein n=1 Tax=Nocardioides plantarum TaxID=29299 RepID=A0ABV5K4U1_9ACTN|nr:Ig-like domain-containing protein [Nocardioides plantarum]
MAQRRSGTHGRRIAAALALGAVAASLLTVAAPPVLAAPAAAAVATAAVEPTTTFTASGACQVYAVPANVGQVDVELVGGAGFAGGGPGSPGGRGGKVTARLDVEPGQYLYVVAAPAAGGSSREQVGGGARHVGGGGGDALKGWGLWDSIDYGGGGGGASWVSTDGSSCNGSGTAVNGDAVLAVAAGGGGGGSEANGSNGGAGGDAGRPGGYSRFCWPIFGGCSDGQNGGGAGGLHGGGLGGSPFASSGAYLGSAPTGTGAAALYRNGGGVTSDGEWGGGGGGGWFGGGQGGNYQTTYGGGGGGSNYVDPGRAAAGTTPDLAVETGGRAPFVSITPAATRKLKVAVDGTGSGVVTADSGGISGAISCGTKATVCAATYATGATTTLTATPGSHQRFAGWGGACSGTTPTCTVTLDQVRAVTATFNQLRRLTWSITGNGSGTIATDPAGFPCGSGCVDVDTGTRVTLTQTPDASSVFRSWDNGFGTCPGLGSCSITLSDRDVHFYANFRQNVLTVRTGGAGSGTVTGTVDGVACATDCSGRHPYGAEVVLTHHAASGSTGQFWSYPCEQSAATCAFTMEGSRSITAGFTKNSRRLDVEKHGSGGGLITSDTPGISCGDGCVDRWFNVEQFTTVTLTATGLSGTPSYDSTFTGWTGACSGTGTCTVTLDQARTVGATFTLVPRHTLTVPGWTGSGTGTILTDVDGLVCTTSCQRDFYTGTQVTLTAVPDPETSVLEGWTGACVTQGATCTVTLDQSRTVSPVLTLRRHQLSVGRTGTGSGSVTSEFVRAGAFPEDISLDCGGVCAADYPHGASVLVEAHPAANALFTGWSGACTGTGQCRVELDRARDVTAEFTRDVRHLAVATAGSGTGTITGDVIGVGGTDLDCGTVCEADFDRFTSVSLTAVPRQADSRFVGWTGACVTTAVVCTTQLADAATATAHFELNTLRVERAGGGTGTVTSSPSGLACGSTCTASYPDLARVVLTATPAAGSTFAGWSAPCATEGTGTCAVTMAGARTVTATFITTPGITVSIAGTGADHGTVAASSGGISCGSAGLAGCSATYSPGQTVTLTAFSDSGSSVRFDHWSGACSGSATTCTLTPADALEVTAVFAHRTRTVTVTHAGSGDGAVVSTPAGFSCTEKVCDVELGIDDHLSLGATADADSTFAGWSGDCSGSGQCNLTDLAADRAVTATFTAKPTYGLALTPRGDGHGYLTTDIAGDSQCAVGDTCSTRHQAGSLVWVTAHPGPHTVFDGWTSGVCRATSGSSCQVSVDDDVTVGAAFGLETGYVYVSSNAYDTGAGTVTSSPAGIADCLDCGASFEVGTTITLTATPAAASTFTKWTPGVCTNVGSDQTGVCELAVGYVARDVTATFTHDKVRLTGSSSGGSGAGSLTFSGTSPSFDCAATCTAWFPYRSDTNVTLTPKPAANMQFVRWASCSGRVAAGSCYLSMFETDHSAVAVFEPIRRTLTTVVQGIGTGTSTGSVVVPATGTSCTSGTCTPAFDQGDPVALVAVPGPDSRFDSWSGACTGTATTCVLTMDAAKNTTARFRGVSRALAITNDGRGSITSTLNPANCAVASCAATFDNGTTVRLYANPSPAHHFVRWTGACAGQAQACSFVLDRDSTATAVYAHDPYALNVARGGAGSGTVSSDVAGIDCGETCSASYDAGSTVVLTATANAPGSTFAGWDGACSGTAPTCTVTMDDARDVTASFALTSRHLDVALRGSGKGAVTTDPAGIDCGETCGADYAHGTSVTLTATPSAGSSFGGWGGACADTAEPVCTVTLDRATEVAATFDLLPLRTLKVTRTGLGTGSVVSDPAGIDCGGTCTVDLPSDAVVTLTATPGATSTFTGWSGDCTGTEPCQVTLGEARTVSADFAAVAQASTTTLAVAATTPFAKAVSATVTVTGPTAPSGTVTIKDGTRVVGTRTLVGGRATLALPASLTVGRHVLTASYGGSPYLGASQSAARTLTVTKATPTVTVKAGTRAVTVTVRATGVVPTGTVQVKEGTKVVGTGILRNGVVTVRMTKLKKGTHKLVVRYLGSATVAAAAKSMTLKVK